jgi:myo-inositol 2-dehydrogenase / D-chiro-inositol 1-dehydrogenase
MAVFRMGLVGAGRMGRTHLRALADNDVLRIVAVADPVESARAAVESPQISVHADLAAMLRAGGLDGVLVASSSDTHLDCIAELADAGMPILCEKPCGLSSRHGSEAAALASTAEVPLQIAYWRRFVPSLKALKTQILAGELGDLYSPPVTNGTSSRRRRASAAAAAASSWTWQCMSSIKSDGSPARRSARSMP